MLRPRIKAQVGRHGRGPGLGPDRHPRGRGSVIGRTLIDGKVIHIPDVLADPLYTQTISQAKGGFRTVLGVPVDARGTPIGVIAAIPSTSHATMDLGPSSPGQHAELPAPIR